jgi:hypothetical protein
MLPVKGKQLLDTFKRDVARLGGGREYWSTRGDAAIFRKVLLIGLLKVLPLDLFIEGPCGSAALFAEKFYFSAWPPDGFAAMPPFLRKSFTFPFP